MREILFRGKAIDGNWYYGVPLVFTEDYVCMTAPHTYNKAVIPATVGQFTGLTDKNGKKIFEGDICRNTRTNEIVSVKWHGTMAGYVWSKRKKESFLYDFGELFRAYDKYEVIGNIHDIPELLEVVE